MSDLALTQSLNIVVQDHSIATGLKSCTTHQEIVQYAASKGFSFSLENWNRQVQSDFSCLSTSDQEKIAAIDPKHWSWAFRQVAQLRAMLMSGA